MNEKKEKSVNMHKKYKKYINQTTYNIKAYYISHIRPR